MVPLMSKRSTKPLVISRRLPDGWARGVENRDPKRCDLDGAPLYIGPGDQIYCDLVHNRQSENSIETANAQFQKQQ
jgi:hypothetical protein